MPPHDSPVSRRPSKISELAERAKIHTWEESASLKYYLRLAENSRKEAKVAIEKKDLENAFVGFARAASLILEKIPNHPDYRTTLSSSQRANLALNGQEILDSLGILKPVLVDQYDKWTRKSQAEGGSAGARSLEAGQVEPAFQRLAVSEDQEQKIREELDLWKRQREDTSRKLQEDRQRFTSSKVNAALSSARAAASTLNQSEFSSATQSGDRPRFPNPATIPYHKPTGNGDSSLLPTLMSRQHAANPSSDRYPSIVNMPNPVPYHPSQESMHGSFPVSVLPLTRISLEDDTLGGSSSSLIMPLESPSKYDGDSTDSEVPSSVPGSEWPKSSGYHFTVNPRSHPTNSAYLPSVTTTAPHSSSFVYPELMSPHQRVQGYVPSSESVFNLHDPRKEELSPIQPPRSGSDFLYSAELLPSHPQVSTPQTRSDVPQYPHERLRETTSSDESLPRRDAPRHGHLPHLKRISLPRDCLSRFLAIAKANTLLNRETCGLLLGKDKGNKYLVTTLLVPRQHATSDTCTMDEEELVMQFTEERSLITLGWIHTHPTQSCFMSSVDLHTHSGFQRMLPESFAVVCAPNANPNFGIFRLTDPPGLQTVLECRETQAFHPHPDVPIYTDADKGHVQMKDLPLEIVDLR